MVDFTATNHGSIITLQPHTANAQDWCDEHLPEDVQMFGHAYVIEPRYYAPIAEAIVCAGMDLS